MKITYEKFFYILMITLIVCFMLSESQFYEINLFSPILKVVKFVAILSIVVFAFIKNVAVTRNIFATTMVLFLFLLINMIFCEGGFSIIPIIFLAWCSKNYSLEKIIKYSIVTIFLTCVFVMVCSSVGLVNDEIQLISRGTEALWFAGDYSRHNFGFLVHNQPAIYFFVLSLLYIILRKNKIMLYELFLIMALNTFVLRYSGSRIVFVLIIFLCVSCYIVMMFNKNKKLKLLLGLAIPIFFICCVFSFWTAYNYSSTSSFYVTLDSLFSNRLRLAHEALHHYGIHLIGAGQNAATYNSSTLVANTVDNGYISFFIQSGIIVWLIIMSFWTYATYIAVKNENHYLTIGLVVVAVENIINPHLCSYLYIPFFCIIMNRFDPLIIKKCIINDDSKGR